jgi:hypothetical protein
MKNITSLLYELTPTGAATIKALRDLNKKGTKKELEGIIDLWAKKSKFRKFLSYINPFRTYDWDILARGAGEILRKRYNPLSV